MPSPQSKPDEAALAAEIATEHAEKAAVVADKAETEAARAASESGRVCPDCKGELVKHSDTSPYKAGCWHCDKCGTCWKPGLREKR